MANDDVIVSALSISRIVLVLGVSVLSALSMGFTTHDVRKAPIILGRSSSVRPPTIPMVTLLSEDEGLVPTEVPTENYKVFGVSRKDSVACAFLLQNRCVQLEVARTESQKNRGLSGRDTLPENRGMLFVFDRTDAHCFWMKDMKFGLDMLWLDERGDIVFMRQNVAPETYPDTQCPDVPARYVVEVRAGMAGRAGLRVGGSLDL